MSLHPLHLEDLRRSGLEDSTIETMGASRYRQRTSTAYHRAGFTAWNRF